MTKRLKLIITFPLFFLLLTFSCQRVQAATYYAAPNGSGSTCSPNSPCDLGTINQKLQAGDTALLKPGNYQEAIIPKNSGNKDRYITYQSTDTNNPATISHKSIFSGIDLSNRSYIIIDSVKVEHTERWGYLNNSEHNIIKNSTFKDTQPGTWRCFQFDDSNYNQILNNSFNGCGDWDRDGTSIKDGGQWCCSGRCLKGDDVGDIMKIGCGSHSNLIEGNHFNRSGHEGLAIHGYNNVIRNNIMENVWQADSKGNIWGYNDGKGNRNGILVGKNGCKASGHNVYEKNIVKNSMPASDQPMTTALKVSGEYQIVRQNQFYNNNHTVLSSNAREKVPDIINNRIYHNVFYNNGNGAWEANTWTGANRHENNIFKNNIVYQNRQSPLERNLSGDDKVCTAEDLWLIQIKGQKPNQVIANSLLKDKPGDSKIVLQVGSSVKKGNIAWFQDPSNNYTDIFKLNIEKPPHFVSEDQLNPDFHLKSTSPLINQGDHLTYTTGSGSGQKVSVKDAAYFFDGFDIVDGDMVQIGSNQPVKITAVDYVNNTLTVNQSISWNNDDAVSLPYTGSKPDIGAFEYGGPGGPTSPPITPSPTPVSGCRAPCTPGTCSQNLGLSCQNFEDTSRCFSMHCGPKIQDEHCRCPTRTPSPTTTPSCTCQSDGDANCDSNVNIVDFSIWREESLAWEADEPRNSWSADFNCDQKVNIVDFSLWRAGLF